MTVRVRTCGRVAAAVAASVTVSAAVTVTGVAHATTGPAPHVLVNVLITDTSVRLSKSSVSDVTYVDFYLHNAGKMRHNFVMGATKSLDLRPGERMHFYVGFPVFGYYRWRVTVHATPRMKGRFHVEAPQPPD